MSIYSQLLDQKTSTEVVDLIRNSAIPILQTPQQLIPDLALWDYIETRKDRLEIDASEIFDGVTVSTWFHFIGNELEETCELSNIGLGYGRSPDNYCKYLREEFFDLEEAIHPEIFKILKPYEEIASLKTKKRYLTNYTPRDLSNLSAKIDEIYLKYPLPIAAFVSSIWIEKEFGVHTASIFGYVYSHRE